jgi:hypothetical protein
MRDLIIFNRLFQIGAGIGGSIALILGIVIGLLIWGGGFEGSLVGPVTFTSGGTKLPRPSGEPWPSSFAADLVDLPLTAAAAVAAGWTDPILCSAGRGRYFTKGTAGEVEVDPYLLMYNVADDLIGVYLYSTSEMPPPWEKLDKILGGGSIPVVDFEHWGVFVYFQDSVKACSVSRTEGQRLL